MQTASRNTPAIGAAGPADARRAAFRELHGPRLHGFALLITLGERALAARIAGEAVAEGADRIDELSHPERAAAWLRRRVLRRARRDIRRAGGTGGHRRAALEDLGVDAVAFAALAGLDVVQRAAVVASTVEGLDAGDVATIVNLDGARLDRLLRRSRTKAIGSGIRVLGEEVSDDGPIADRIHAIASSAMS